MAALGRLVPLGLAVLLAMSTLDEAGRPIPGHPSPLIREYLARFRFADRLQDQWLIALVLFVLLWGLGRVLGPPIARLGGWRRPVAIVALVALGTSELILVPLLQWAEGRTWAGAFTLTALRHDSQLLARSGAPTAYLFFKGVAALAAACAIWPSGAVTAKGTPPAVKLALAGWAVTVWTLGSLVHSWNPRHTTVELRPWEAAHLLSALWPAAPVWPVIAVVGLVAMVCAWPGILGLYGHAARGNALRAVIDGTPPTPLRTAPMLAVVLLVLLLQPFWWYGRLIGSFVNYPDLWDPILGTRYDTRHLAALFRTPVGATSLLLPLILAVARAIAEVGLAGLGAWGFLRLSGKARGMLAFVLAGCVVVGSIAPGVATAYIASTRVLPALPWPRHLLGFPLVMVALIGMAGAWPARIAANPELRAVPISFPRRVLLAAFCGLFVAGYLDQAPLLLPPNPREVAYWPTVVLVQVLSTRHFHLPDQLAYSVGWHLPVWIALAVAAIALTPRSPRGGGNPMAQKNEAAPSAGGAGDAEGAFP